jgi:hypothetical protein
MIKEDLLKELRCLNAINYNLYIGSGTDACDLCLDYDEAIKELENLIQKSYEAGEQNILKEIEKKCYGRDAYKIPFSEYEIDYCFNKDEKNKMITANEYYTKGRNDEFIETISKVQSLIKSYKV